MITRQIVPFCVAFLVTPVLYGRINLHPTVAESLGLNIHFLEPAPGEMEMLTASGARWVRMDFAWSSTERARGQYDFSAYDRYLATLDQHKVRTILILDYTNALYDNGQSPASDEAVQAFSAWAAAAVKHFEGRGVMWELYNEPNSGFWKPKRNDQAYIRLALSASEAIYEAAPRELLVGPASATVDLGFLEACFKAGLLNYWAAVTVHPYRQLPPETADSELRAARLLIRRYGPPGKTIPVIAGEWGYSSAWKWDSMDEELQGKLMARELLSNLANGIPLTIWYDWHDDGQDAKNAEFHFGTVHETYHRGRHPVFDPKPAYLSARTVASVLGSFHYNKRLSLADSRDIALLFDSGGAVRLAAWTINPEAHEAVIPANPGAFRVVGYTGERLQSIAADKTGLKVTLTNAPQYLIPEKPNALLQVAAAWEQAPLEVAETGPKEVSISLRVENPLSHPITVSADKAPHKIAPHSSTTLSNAAYLGMAAAPAAAPVTVAVRGMGQLSQLTYLVPTNPLRVSLTPAAGAILPLGVENPAAIPFSGWVALDESEGLEPGTAEAALELKPGEKERDVDFPLSSPSQKEYRVGVTVKDRQGKAALRVPAMTFRRVDEFERYLTGSAPAAYAVVPDGDPHVASEQSVTANAPAEGPPRPGMGALKLSYKFTSGWKFARLAATDPSIAAIPGAPKRFGLWVHGDGQGNAMAVRFVDATGQTFQEGYSPVAWTNWRYCVFFMDAAYATHWGGANEGVIHYPIRWESLFLIDSGRRQATHGALYLSAPTLIY